MRRRDATVRGEKHSHTLNAQHQPFIFFQNSQQHLSLTFPAIDAHDPETPAPVFAARAIKSAIFGTPAPPPGDTTMAERLADFTKAAPGRDMDTPSKPQGILMTPGTARTRKTVSFGGGVKDEAGVAGVKEGSKSGIPDDCPGKFPSPWVANVPKVPSKLGDGSLRRTALTRSMERVRDTRRKVNEEREGKNKFPSIPDSPIPTRRDEKEAERRIANMPDTPKPMTRMEQKEAQHRFPSIPDSPILEKAQEKSPTRRFPGIPDVPVLERPTLVKAGDNDGRPRSRRGSEPDAPGTLDGSKAATTSFRQSRTSKETAEDISPDTTIDMNQPRSKSGQYWKANYELYHEDAKAQMKQLIRYKQLAKDYAKKKDEEAIDLAEKLQEEQVKVMEMEDALQQMVGMAAEGMLNGETESPGFMKALARQTALAVQYKSQVDKFRIALENREKERSGRVSSSDEDGGLEAEHRHDDRTMARLRQDIQTMCISLTAAEKKAATLSEENSKLSRDLARTKEELLQSEKRREAADARQDDTNKLLEELQKSYNTLKEAAKSQRRDAEHLLKRRAEQVADLKREIKTLKRASRHHGDEPVHERSTSRLSGELELDERGNKRRSTSARPTLETAELVVEPTRPSVRTRSSSERRLSRAAETTTGRDRVDENKRGTEETRSKTRRSRINLKDYLSEARKERVTSQSYKSQPDTSVLTEVANTRVSRQQRSISPAKRHTTDLSLRERFTTLSNKPIINPREESPIKGATAGYESPLKPDSETAEDTQRMRISSNTAVFGASIDYSKPSPRPSRYNAVQDDTPTPSRVRYSMTEGRSFTKGPLAGDDSRMGESRLSNMDPDRAAAAKARLEMRSRERRRAKENTARENGREENTRIPA